MILQTFYRNTSQTSQGKRTGTWCRFIYISPLSFANQETLSLQTYSWRSPHVNLDVCLTYLKNKLHLSIHFSTLFVNPSWLIYHRWFISLLSTISLMNVRILCCYFNPLKVKSCVFRTMLAAIVSLAQSKQLNLNVMKSPFSTLNSRRREAF